MTKYLKLYNTDTERTSFESSVNYEEPYTGRIKNTTNIFYNKSDRHGGQILPYDAEIEYLESTGTQYIDTDIILTKNFQIEMNAAFIYKSGFQVLIGSYVNSSIYGTPLGINGNGYPYIQVGDGNSYVYFTSSVDYVDSVMRLWVAEGNGSTQYLTYNGTTKSKAITGDLPTITMYLFARSNTSGAGNYTYAKIGKTSITINGVLVRNFIPVRVGQVGYMYDKVSGQLFGNSGTGNFILGPDV